MQSKEIEITNEAGIHTRLASFFVQTASKFISNIELENLITGKKVDAKSIAMVLSLGLKYGTIVRICAEGADEKQAVDMLALLLEKGLKE